MNTKIKVKYINQEKYKTWIIVIFDNSNPGFICCV